MRKSRRQPRSASGLPSRPALVGLQLLVLILFLLAWHVLTAVGWLDPFFFGRPLAVLART
jgi:NitT/TauT family transport system permease protein